MPKTKATFIEPMLLLRVEKLPQGADWSYEIKLDGYRALAIKSGGKVQLRSRNDNDFTERYSSVATALLSMPNETVLDGEVAALDEEGRPSFNLLQNYGSADAPLVYFVFALLMLKGQNVMAKPLSERRALLESEVLPKLGEPVRYSPELKAGLPDLIASVKSAGLEGLVAKRRNSRYEPGQRSGAWQKMRINRGQEFVIGGYTPSDRNFDALIFGYSTTGIFSMLRVHVTDSHPLPRTAVQEVEAAGDQGMSLREPSRGEERQVGRRADRGEDEGLPLA